MTPMICDYSGKVIVPKYGKALLPERDYYLFHDKIVSAESKEALDKAIRTNMDKFGFGKYNLKAYQNFVIRFAAEACDRGRTAQASLVRQLGSN